MGLQQSVYQVNGLAEVGGLVDTAATALINEAPACRVNGNANVGGFVWAASAPAGSQVNPLEKYVTASSESAVAPIGFVYRVQDGVLPCNQGATLAIADGQPCPVIIRGRAFAASKTSAVVGNKVLANIEDGSVYTGANAENATYGTLEFVAVSAYSSWTSTTSGKLKLVIDGKTVALTGLNFGSVDSISAIATVLDTALSAYADVAANTAGTGLVFTSKTTGNSSSVAYVAENGDIGTLLGASTASNVVATQGVAALVDTGWTVKTAATVGNLFIIERY